MSARYSYYLLADSREGRAKEQDVSGKILADNAVTGDIRQGFVYERAPHITLKSIANNAEIDVIWEKWQAVLEPLRRQVNAALDLSSPSPSGLTRGFMDGRVEPDHDDTGGWQEWEIPAILTPGSTARTARPRRIW